MSAPTAAASVGLNLNPTLADLLAVSLEPAFLLPAVLVSAYYFWRFVQVRRTPEGRARWPVWKALLFALGVLAMLLATQNRAATLAKNSMALYMGRLMVLAEVVPPLLILSIPRNANLTSRNLLGKALSVLLDPWVALAVWAAVIIYWNVPAGLNASVVTNTAATLLPMLYLLSGLLVWGVILRPLPGVQFSSVGSRGWFGLLVALPMMSVAAVWLYSPRVLYSPYVGALCLWNLSPLQNQQLSGWIMMMAGLPAMLLAFIQLFIWLINLSEGQGLPEADR